jgi:hypothetical protein
LIKAIIILKRYIVDKPKGKNMVRGILTPKEKIMSFMLKIQKLKIETSNAEKKWKAYVTLAESDFMLDKNAIESKTIDEKPEHFEDIRGKKLIVSLPLHYKTLYSLSRNNQTHSKV